MSWAPLAAIDELKTKNSFERRAMTDKPRLVPLTKFIGGALVFCEANSDTEALMKREQSWREALKVEHWLSMTSRSH
jgi:hypothetical protein